MDVIEHGRQIDNEMAKKMVQKGITYVPTLSGQKSNATPGWGREDIQPRFAASWPLLEFSVKNTVKNNVNIVAGTDCLGSVCEEIVLLHEIGGMSPIDSLKAATIKAAKLMDMDKQIGTIEEGKLADFIIVDGDPFKNLSILEDNVKHISFDGKWYNTDWFAAIVPDCSYWVPGF